MCEYEPGKVPREWFCLHVEVPERLIAATTANQLDDITVNA